MRLYFVTVQVRENVNLTTHESVVFIRPKGSDKLTKSHQHFVYSFLREQEGYMRKALLSRHFKRYLFAFEERGFHAENTSFVSLDAAAVMNSSRFFLKFTCVPLYSKTFCDFPLKARKMTAQMGNMPNVVNRGPPSVTAILKLRCAKTAILLLLFTMSLAEE